MTEIYRPSLPEKDAYNVGIIGATGLVGSYMLQILEERDFPVEEMRVFSSVRSAGRKLAWREQVLVAEDTERADFEGLDIAFFSAGKIVSKGLAPIITDLGATVIDNSSAWRQNDKVPLVVTEVNSEALANTPLGIVANHNCSTTTEVIVLKPLDDEANLEELIVTTLQAASGAGQEGIEELHEQVPLMDKGIVTDWETGYSAKPVVFPEPIAFNVIPLRGEQIGRDTTEELKLVEESRKILDIAKLAVSATCISVPVYVGHSLAIEARFEKPIFPEDAEELLSKAEGVELVDVPTPLKAAGRDVSLVGRIRQSRAYGHNGLSMVVCGDNLRKGAALNAVQIAEKLIGKS